MTSNTKNFGAQYQCLDCGAIWDANDREPHDCVVDIPDASTMRQQVQRMKPNYEQLRKVKVAINEMLRTGETHCIVRFPIDMGVQAHLESKGYTVRKSSHRVEPITEISI